mmetsp:Transcript_9772/g.31373  ORF Transcript_9772/g.31373 Transcript_9772/m.31373 type:complete len:224 (+) Transcript_9772:50-721(+)
MGERRGGGVAEVCRRRLDSRASRGESGLGGHAVARDGVASRRGGSGRQGVGAAAGAGEDGGEGGGGDDCGVGESAGSDGSPVGEVGGGVEAGGAGDVVGAGGEGVGSFESVASAGAGPLVNHLVDLELGGEGADLGRDAGPAGEDGLADLLPVGEVLEGTGGGELGVGAAAVDEGAEGLDGAVRDELDLVDVVEGEVPEDRGGGVLGGVGAVGDDPDEGLDAV